MKYANVEGVYRSGSMLLLISIPVAVWDLLRPNPAMSFVAFLRSVNLQADTQEDGVSPQVGNALNTNNDPIFDALTQDASQVGLPPFFSDSELLYFQVFIEEIAAWMDALDYEKTVTAPKPMCISYGPLILH